MNKNFINYLSLVIIALILMALSKCSYKTTENHKNNIKSIYNNIYLLDVNDKELYDNARIKGAINVSYENLKEETKNFDKDFKIIVYCSDYTCIESTRVAKELKNLGFKNVMVYKGGIRQWYQLSIKDPTDYPYEGPATLQFLSKPIDIKNFKDFKDKELEDNKIQVISSVDLSKLLKVNIK